MSRVGFVCPECGRVCAPDRLSSTATEAWCWHNGDFREYRDPLGEVATPMQTFHPEDLWP